MCQGHPQRLSGKKPACQSGRRKFDPWVRKNPWRRKWQPTPVFLPGKSHRESSLEGYSPWGRKRVRHDLITDQQQIMLSAFISGYKPMLAGEVRMHMFGGIWICLFTYLNLSFFIYKLRMTKLVFIRISGDKMHMRGSVSRYLEGLMTLKV